MLLWVLPLFSFAHLLRFIGVVPNPMACSFRFFIHWILLDLGLEDFPAFEPVHIIAPIGATFLSQRAAQLKASSKHPIVESSTGDATRAPPSGDPFAEAYVDPTVVVDPPPSTSSAFSLRAMLDTVRTV